MRPAATKPALSVVVLTLDEERNIGPCLAALALQEDLRFEVILIDAASRDGTLRIARAMASAFPIPLRIQAESERLPIGAARNLGVALARADAIAFLSADAEPDPQWTARALAGLAKADMVFGRQVHAPHRWTAGAAVRGLRYDFPRRASTAPGGPDPLRLASNVAAAFRKQVLLANPFDPETNAAEDLLLARRAAAQGKTALYDPAFAVRHHDVASARIEWRKNLREGRGWAEYRTELGLLPLALGWGAALTVATGFLVFAPGPLSALALATALWLPAVRRAVRRRTDPMPVGAIVLGVAASPVFDLAFLASYAAALLRRPAPAAPPPPLQLAAQEMRT